MTAQHEPVPTTHPAIAVLGATGAVGAEVAAILHAKGHHVIAVSRHANRADGSPTRLDRVRGEFTDPASIGDITPGVAVNCTGIEDLNSVQRWRDAGWAVIDITASSQYANDLDATSVTITCLVGLGEDYGDAPRGDSTSPTGYCSFPKNTLRSPPGIASTPVSLGESSQSPAPSRKPPSSSTGSTSCHVEPSAVTAITADRLTRGAHSRARYLWDLIETAELQADLASLGVLVTIEQHPLDKLT